MLGGIWGCILSELKESPLTIPKKNSGRDFDFPPRPSLKRPKEGPQPFLWKPSWGCGRFSGDGRGRFAARDYGGRWDGGRKMKALVPAVIPSTPLCGKRSWRQPGRSRTGIGRSSPQPSAYSPPFCRGRALSRPARGCWELRWPSDVRPVPRRPRLPCVKGAVAALPRLRDCPRLLDTLGVISATMPSHPSHPRRRRSALRR